MFEKRPTELVFKIGLGDSSSLGTAAGGVSCDSVGSGLAYSAQLFSKHSNIKYIGSAGEQLQQSHPTPLKKCLIPPSPYVWRGDGQLLFEFGMIAIILNGKK